MGNTCVCRQTDEDEAEDALLSSFDGEGSGPRGPPPPYQPQAPIYAYHQMSEEQRLQLMQRLTLIQCLPCARYQAIKSPEKKGEKEDWGEKRECPICMMEFVVGEPIRLLPCMHYYHLHCIDDWLMRSLTCPSCMERVDISIRNTVYPSRPSRPHRRRRRSSSHGPGSRHQRASQTSSNPSSPSHEQHVQLLGPPPRQLSLETIPPIPRRMVSPPVSPSILLPPPPPVPHPPSSPVIRVSAGMALRHRRNPSSSSSSSN